jgi:hypothetical protein
MNIFDGNSFHQPKNETPIGAKNRVSTLDRRDLFFKEILSYLPARNKYILSSAHARSVYVQKKEQFVFEPSNRLVSSDERTGNTTPFATKCFIIKL